MFSNAALIPIFVLQALRLDLTEQSEQHRVELSTQQRHNEQLLEKRDKQHKEDKMDMEKDIKKLVKLIDKLKKKIARLGELVGQWRS